MRNIGNKIQREGIWERRSDNGSRSRRFREMRNIGKKIQRDEEIRNKIQREGIWERRLDNGSERRFREMKKLERRSDNGSAGILCQILCQMD